MASVIHELVVGSRKADGSVNAGGRVYLTRPGTDTRVTAYADRDLLATISLSSGGILLGADGKRAIYVTEPATVREETSDGTHIATYTALTDVNAKLVEVENAGFTGTLADGTQGAGGRTYLDTLLTSAKTSTNGLDFQYLQSASATKRPIHEWMTEVHMSVVNFGAVGDDIADDTTAIQRTINAAAAAGGGRVFFPSGTYRISAVLTLPASNIHLFGVGANLSVIKQMSTTANGVSLSSGAGSIRSLRITADTTSTGTGISLGGNSNVIEDVTVALFRTGIAGSGLAQSGLSRIVISGDGNASWVGISGDLQYSTVIGALLSNSSNNGTAVVIDTATAGPVVLIDVRASTTVLGIDIQNVSGGVTMIGCSMAGSTSSLKTAAGVGAVREFGCSWGGGGVADGRTGSPVILEISATGSVTPVPNSSPVTRVVATAGSITATIGNVTAGLIGQMHTIVFVNASGGSVTWAFASDWVVSATGVPNPSTGNETAIIFQRSGGKMREVGTRVTTAT